MVTKTEKFENDRRVSNNQHERLSNWHLDKTLSLSHILTTILMAGSIFYWANAMDKRVTVIETNSTHYDKDINAQAVAVRESISEIKSSLIRIEIKLDNKVDKRK
jgi:hypothetical protein